MAGGLDLLLTALATIAPPPTKKSSAAAAAKKIIIDGETNERGQGGGGPLPERCEEGVEGRSAKERKRKARYLAKQAEVKKAETRKKNRERMARKRREKREEEAAASRKKARMNQTQEVVDSKLAQEQERTIKTSPTSLNVPPIACTGNSNIDLVGEANNKRDEHTKGERAKKRESKAMSSGERVAKFRKKMRATKEGRELLKLKSREYVIRHRLNSKNKGKQMGEEIARCMNGKASSTPEEINEEKIAEERWQKAQKCLDEKQGTASSTQEVNQTASIEEGPVKKKPSSSERVIKFRTKMRATKEGSDFLKKKSTEYNLRHRLNVKKKIKQMEEEIAHYVEKLRGQGLKLKPVADVLAEVCEDKKPKERMPPKKYLPPEDVLATMTKMELSEWKKKKRTERDRVRKAAMKLKERQQIQSMEAMLRNLKEMNDYVENGSPESLHALQDAPPSSEIMGLLLD